MKRTALIVLSAALVAAVTILPARAAADAMPAVGQMAPTFTLPSQMGTRISLKNYRGKWVVLYFYPKDLSPGCTIEAHNFEHTLSQFHAKNAVILGVSVDSVAMHAQFSAKDGLTFHLLADPSHNVVNMYGSLGSFRGMTIAMRNTFLINPEGKIVHVWTKVDPRMAASEVLAVIPNR